MRTAIVTALTTLALLLTATPVHADGGTGSRVLACSRGNAVC